MFSVNMNRSLHLPLLTGLAVAPALALDLGVAEFGSEEPDELGFLGGGPAASRRSLLNSNFLFTGAYEQTSGNTLSSGSQRTELLLRYNHSSISICAQKNVLQL